MMMHMKRPTIRSPYLGSGVILRFSTTRRRGIYPCPARSIAGSKMPAAGRGIPNASPAAKSKALLRSLRPVLRTALVPVGHASRIEGSPHDVVPHTRQILHAPTPHQHHGVLLQRVAYAGNVRVHFASVGEPDARHLAKRRVWLFRRRGEHAHADRPLLRRRLKVGRFRLLSLPLAPEAHELLDGRHGHSTGKTAIAPEPILTHPSEGRRAAKVGNGSDLVRLLTRKT